MSLALAAVAMLFPRQLAAAIAQEKTRLTAEALGMPKEDHDEVIQAWLDWYKTVPLAIEWNRIHRAVVLRGSGSGLSWKPPDQAATALEILRHELGLI